MIVSVKLPGIGFSSPLIVTRPVTLRSRPVPVMLRDVAWNAPDDTSKLPTTFAVSEPTLELNTIGPVNEALGR